MPKYKSLGQVWTPREIVEFMLDKVNLNHPHLRILEPACGEGIFLEVLVNRLKGKRYEIHCVDIDREALEITKRKFHDNPNVKFFYADFLKEFKGFGYDLIISNPPYIRIQNIPDGYKEFLFKNFKLCRGDTDIFYAFIEKSLKILNNKGYLAFIIPNSWLWSRAGEPFRNFLRKMGYYTEVYDFDHFQIFDDVSTYVSIIILRKEEGLYYSYYRFDGSGFEGKTLSWHKVRYFKVVDNEIVEMVQSQPLKIGDIRVGIATLCDRVFIFEPEGEDKNFYLYKGFKIEKSITKEIIKNSRIKSREDIKNNRLRIIFPYKSGKLIDENVFKEEFPNAYKYLMNHKEKLLKRDKGKKVYQNWYAFGRTQGIKTLFGKKILTPAFSKKPNFVYCDKEEALFYAGYGIFNPPYDFDVVEKILNSSLIESYMNTISKPYRNNWRSYSKDFLEKIKLPILNPDEIDKLKNITKKEEIDEFVLWLYRRKGIGGSVKKKLF